MIKIDKQSYSIFEDINLINSASDKKNFKNIVNDFKNSICEIYNIDNNLIIDKINYYDIKFISFLIDLGVIKSREEVEKLKLTLGKDYKNIFSVFNEYLNLNIVEENILLKKFMDIYRKESILEYIEDSKSPTIVDLFCGAGGMSLGFTQNGYKVLLANDIERVCTTTYSFNHIEVPKDRIITGDIKSLVENVDKHINQKVDVVVGGPPCQGFSNANRQRIIDDPRNILYKYYVKAIENLKPQFFIMENVKGMLSVAEQIREDFHQLKNVDYDVSYHVFNAKDFSVPQNRERLIYIGIRSDIRNIIDRNATDIINEILQYTATLDKYSLIDAIGDLRSLKALTIKNATELDSYECGKKIEKNELLKNTKYANLINQNIKYDLLFNHKARFNNDRDIEIFARMLPGDKSDSERIADIMPYTSRKDIFKDKYYKLKPDDICKTITAHMKFDCNMYIHPNQARGLTPREAARVQSYPDNYFFLGPFTKTYMQIGNSVPPLMTRAISNILKKYILED